MHSMQVFSSLDYYITRLLMKWALRKYRGQHRRGKSEVYAKVFYKIGTNK